MLVVPVDISLSTAQMQGEAQREVVRVTVECCLQERAWNGYYAQLLGSLVKTVKGHRITLQFCLWDLIKAVRSFNRLPSFHRCSYVRHPIFNKTMLWRRSHYSIWVSEAWLHPVSSFGRMQLP